MSLTATLIANPNTPLLTDALCIAAANAVNATSYDWLARGIAVDIILPETSGQSAEDNREKILMVLKKLPIDVVIQNSNFRQKKALIADMDSTIIEQECIDELAAEIGIKDQVSNITARAMNGEIEFEPALRERVALLAGMHTDIITKVLRERITYTPGGAQLLATMKKSDAYCALVSGGFTAFTDAVAEKLGFDHHRANQLIIENNQLTGKVTDPILGQQAKVDALHEIAMQQNLQSEDFIAVGDGANDLGMLKIAGSGVALHAKPSVAEQADIRIDHGDLTALLYIQGYSQDEIIQ